MKLGIFNNGKIVRVSKNSMNRHISIFGKRGSGKSVRLKEIITDAVNQGKTVISFNLERSGIEDGSPYINCIDAAKDGINLPILDMSAVKDGKETRVGFITYLTELLAGTESLGCRQMGALREAIEHALDNRERYESDLSAIADGLLLQDSTTAKGVYNKLWALLCSDAFKKSEKGIKPGMLNIFALGSMAPSTQCVMVELILGSIWRQARMKDSNPNELVIVIDEFQRLRLKKDSLVCEMLREARQYNISLILATQSSEAINKDVLKAVNGTAISLYFQPNASEAKRIAEIIDSQQVERFTMQLKKLQKGQSIVTGKIDIEGYENDKPVIIKSEYGSKPVIVNPSQILEDKKSNVVD